MKDLKELLKNAYDLHIHAGPDVVPRKAMDHELARGVMDWGMRGYASKSHYFDTAGRAALIRAMFPACNAVGGIVLNNSVGGLNPVTVEMLARCEGTNIVWFPTIDAQNMWDSIKTGTIVPWGAASSDPSRVRAIRVLVDGKLAAPVYDILDLIARNDMILATGHISKHESLALLREAKKRGVRRMIATHCEYPATFATVEEQKEYVRCGAKVEHNSLTTVLKQFSIDQLVEHIRGVGAENIILTSDLGQSVNAFPMEGFAAYVKAILEAGISEREMEQMIVTNPALLVE